MAESRSMDVQIYTLRGELTLEDCLKLRNLVREVLKTGLINIIFDLEKVTHIHLSGIPTLIQSARLLRGLGGDLKLATKKAYLLHVLELAGAKQLLDVHDGCAEAARCFSDGRIPEKDLALIHGRKPR